MQRVFKQLFLFSQTIIKTTHIAVIFTLSFFMFSAHAASLPSTIEFKRLSKEHGLSQSYAYDIKQDNDGFIWIATQDGLNKYDGHKFEKYKHNLADPHSLTHNFVRKIFIDNEGGIWIGTHNGLNKYNKDLNNFDAYLHDENDKTSLADNQIWNIYQDKEGRIWVATRTGLHRYESSEKSFKRIRVRDHEEKLQEIKTILQDKQGNFWVGTFENGIFIVNGNLDSAFSLKKGNKWGLNISANNLSDIKVIDGKYWLATDNGVYVIDNNYKITQHYQYSDNADSILSNSTKSILQIDESNVWVGTINGISSINLHDNTITQYQNTEYLSSLSDNYVFKLTKDNAGKIWVGTEKGLSIFDKISTSFAHIKTQNDTVIEEIDTFAELGDNSIVYSHASDGIYKRLVDGTTIKLPINITQYLSHIIPVNNGLYLRTYNNQLFFFNGKDTIEHPLWQSQILNDTDSKIYALDSELWFINEKGKLISYSTQSQEFTVRADNQLHPFKRLYIEDQQTFWLIDLNNRIEIFNPTNNQLKLLNGINNENFIISNAKSILTTKKWIFMGSYDQGLMLINKESNKTWVFNDKNALNSNTINHAFHDKNNNFWFSTSEGISMLDPDTKQVMNFGANFGITVSEFIAHSGIYSSDDKAYFGGINGYIVFRPLEIVKIEQKLNAPSLSNLFIANKKIAISKTTSTIANDTFTLPKHINELETLKLAHQQGHFSLEFVSPNAKLDDQLAYRYRLLGYQEDWLETESNKRTATYTNLSAGEYVFELEVIDLLNTAKTQSKSLNITIAPPWWLSQAALIFYFLLLLTIAGYILQQMRHKRLYHLQIKLSEERLKLSLWGSGDEMWDWNIKKGKIYRSNIWGILEFPQDGKRNVGADQTNIHQQDIPRIRQALTDHFDNKTEHFESTYRVKDKDDKWIWVLDRGKIVERDEKNKPTRMTGTLKDISQIKKADERLKLFAKCIENISDAVVIYDRQFTVIDVNKAYQRITGATKSDELGNSLVFKEYPDAFTQNVKKHLITKGSWHGEIKSKRNNGELYSTDLNIDIIRNESNNISHFVGVFSDITKRKENEAELLKLANSDTLTGLPNRSYFQANQTRLVQNKVPHALLVFDLDNFKKINDSLGHGVGDQLLVKVAERMLNIGRQKDTVYRLGGDEFSIIIEDTNDIHTITSIAKDILSSIAQPLKIKSQEIVLYSSIGIVLYPEDGVSPQELLKNADTAMYHAKDSGGNKYQFFSDSMNKKAVKRLQVENLIRRGLKDDYFSVFYQPKIEISTGKVAGMEALVRFETPTKGIISPVVFIPVSEETGQIIDIGEIVLRKSCFATKKWVDAGLFEGRIAVNLSAVQFTQPNLVAMIEGILRDSQLPAKYLELEITEGTVMDSPQAAIDTMLQIRAMGIHLSLDDFGTGYSSLAYLKKFPLNTLKIDKAFVDDIETSEQGRNMVATIVTIAHNLGLQVVAEGVETNQQLSFLSGLRCEQLQGYLYSKPLPEDNFHKYLLSHHIADKSTSFN